MQCVNHGDVGSFLAAAGPLLRADEAVNTVLTGVVLASQAGDNQEAQEDGAPLVTVRDATVARLAATLAAPYGLVLSRGNSDAISSLAGWLEEASLSPSSVTGPDDTAEIFARIWCACHGAQAVAGTRMKLYLLSRVVPPPPTPGMLRVAVETDTGWLAAWRRRFIIDTGLPHDEAAESGDWARQRIAAGQVLYWRHEGRPVAAASFQPTALDGDAGRIDMVLTHEAKRGRGYATACVAAVSQYLLEKGWRYCLIFTDTENPAPNRIYPQIGYRIAGGYRSVTFETR